MHWHEYQYAETRRQDMMREAEQSRLRAQITRRFEYRRLRPLRRTFGRMLRRTEREETAAPTPIRSTSPVFSS